VLQDQVKVILLAEDLTAAGFSLPLLATDRIVIQGKEFTPTAPPDDSTRRIGDTLIAYELALRGGGG
jgi:hypothetical protein